MKNSKGMTVVELLIAISIFSILIGMMYSVYNANIKSINKTQIKGELQSEAQLIQRMISDIGIQSNGIDDLSVNYEDENGYFEVNYIDMKVEVEENKFNTYRFDINMNYIDEEYIKILRLQQIDVSLEENKIINEWEISKNIDSFKIKPIGGKDFKDTKSIDTKIELKYKKGFVDENKIVSSIITFRNKK